MKLRRGFTFLILLTVVIVSLSLVSAGFFDFFKMTGKAIDSSEVLIEEDFGVLGFISSSVLEDNCELMELEGIEDPHTCDSYRATYDVEGEGLGSVELIVEVRDEEPTNKEEIVSNVANNIAEKEEMSLNIEGINGQKVYTLEKGDGGIKSVVVLWASGNKIIGLFVEDWDTTLLDDDIFEDLSEAYLEKYPSDLTESSECSVYTTMDSCLDNESCAWDQKTDSCIKYIPGICSDPDGGIDYFTQAHTYGYRASYADERDMRIKTGGLDACIPGTSQVREHYCTEEGYIASVNYNCPKGCVEGACIPENLVVDFGEIKKLVVDYETGLTWQRLAVKGKNFDSARNFCEVLNAGGFGDWRLPTEHELRLFPVERVGANKNYWTSEENFGPDIVPSVRGGPREYNYAVVLKWDENGAITEQNLVKTSTAYTVCVRDEKLSGEELTGTQTCQLCRRFDSSFFFGGFLGFGRSIRPLTTGWDCVGFDDDSLNTDFLMDVYERSSLSLSVSCGDFNIAEDCHICRRYADHNRRESAKWDCVGFDGKVLKTNFVGDVDRNDDFDLLVTCDSEEVRNSCQLCKKYADRNGRAGVEWTCEFFNKTILFTDFVGDVDENDDFDLKVRCEEEIAPEPGKCFDSDGGLDYYTVGSCTDAQGDKVWDKCVGKVLTEYVCGDEEECIANEFTCPYRSCINQIEDHHGACTPREEENDVYFVYSKNGNFDVSLNDVLGDNHELADVDFKNSRFRIEVDERMLSAITSNSGYSDGMVKRDYDAEDYASIISIDKHNYEDTEVSDNVFEGTTLNIDVLENQSIFNLSEEESDVYLFVDEQLDTYHSRNVATIHSSRKGYMGEEEVVGIPARPPRISGTRRYLFIQPAPTFTGGVWQAGEANKYGSGAYIYVDFFGDLHLRYKTENQNSRAVFSVGILACECSPGEERCDGNNYLTCDNNCSWTNNGEVTGQCGVIQECVDSDDGGNNPYVVGDTWGCDDVECSTGYREHEEYCVALSGSPDPLTNCTGDNCGVYEFYCENNLASGNIIPCSIGCTDRACISCLDSDGGEDYSEFGSVTGKDIVSEEFITESDICLGNILVEKSCRNGYLVDNFFECPYDCENGACLSIDCSVEVGNESLCGETLYFASTVYCDVEGVGKYDLSSDNVSICELGCSAGICEVATCSDNDKGAYENVTTSSANDSLGDIIEDSCDGNTLKEAVCVEGEVDTVDYECEFGCEEGRCLGESSCEDSDGGLNYFEKGQTTSCVGDNCIVGENESCLDEDILWESYCGKNDEIVFQQFSCPEGCVGGACNIPEEKPKATCDAVALGGPEIKPGTRLIVEAVLSYCDPFTLEYVAVKGVDESCTNDYECESNVCIEGKCSSIREELETQREILEEQTTILQEIRCWLRDFIGVQDYDECLNESLGE